jgi:glutaredoxin
MMEYLKPMTGVYTIYTRSDCPYCKMVLDLLKNENPPVDEICCDDYITQPKDKDRFFQFIQQISGKSHKTFPVVFLDEEFIGGYTETKAFVEYVNTLYPK